MEVDQTRAGSRPSEAKKKRSNVLKVFNWGDNPPIVMCLCGPDRFKSEFLGAFRAFTLAGHIVLLPPFFDNTNGDGFLNKETREKLNELHMRKIDMADLVYVINPKGITNETTRREIEYAESLGKMIKYLES